MKNKNFNAALVDWGTSSFRLWLLNKNGEIEEGVRSNEGMSTLKAPADFEGTLEAHLKILGVVDDLPVVICGMAGARQGWMEAAYVETPADLDEIVSANVKIPHIERDVRILPGVSQTVISAPDVMRGEETQLLGASKLGGAPSVICMPGTHSKWVSLETNKIREFNSFMTGEIYALLSKNSTLSHSINDDEMDLAAFDLAAKSAIENPELFSHELFSVRAAPLLNRATMAQAKGKLSGMLIGLEFAGAKKYFKSEVTLIGAGKLADLYKRVFDLVGIGYNQIDAEKVVCVGLKYAAKRIWNDGVSAT